MNRTLPLVTLLLTLTGPAFPQATDTVLFTDSFASGALAPDWTVVEGHWTITDGALTNTGGGLIVLNRPPGDRFTLEAQVNFPGNWSSLILLYETPDDYGTLYFAGGYWEYFDLDGGALVNYVQHRDLEITAGVDHEIKVTCDFGLATLHYDGKLKGEAPLRPRPGSRIALRNLPKGGRLQLKSLRVTQPATPPPSLVAQLPPASPAQSVIYADLGLQGKALPAERLTGDAPNGLRLPYAFAAGDTFESRFARLPLDSPPCRRLLFEVEGDGSKNRFFVILHDRSGEQHLVAEAFLSWQGWRELGVDLKAFLTSPDHKQRLANRWGGDGNQMIDFPLTAVDIGVAKRSARVKDSGQVRFRNLRLVE
jgi:hypothetical protein